MGSRRRQEAEVRGPWIHLAPNPAARSHGPTCPEAEWENLQSAPPVQAAACASMSLTRKEAWGVIWAYE